MPRPSITCVRCTSAFHTFAPGQAHGCAADVHTAAGIKGIYGHYGSQVADCTFFAFTKDTPFADGQHVCDGCIRTLVASGDIQERPYPSPALERDEDEEEDLPDVCCTRCKATFPAFAAGQAHGCAADIHTAAGIKGIYGHYGSAIADGTFFAFTKGTTFAEDQHICDGCIQTLQSSGAIQERPYPQP